MKISYFEPKFDEKSYSDNMVQLTTALTSLTLGNNFSGQIIEDIEIPATTTIKIAHSLKQTPKYRIILKDTKSGQITDEAIWNDKYIYLRNNSANATIISILLMRG